MAKSAGSYRSVKTGRYVTPKYGESPQHHGQGDKEAEVGPVTSVTRARVTTPPFGAALSWSSPGVRGTSAGPSGAIWHEATSPRHLKSTVLLVYRSPTTVLAGG